MDNNSTPSMVKIFRGSAVESEHHVDIVVCDAAGKIQRAWGDPDRLIFPRSAIKMMQAIPLVESGAYDHFQLAPQHLAISCASHNGEPVHVELVTDWLKHLGLNESHLKCGSHDPYHQPSLAALLKTDTAPCQIHNNCSGKHVGILATTTYLGDSLADYTEVDHPSQIRIRSVLEDLTGLSLTHAPWERDGCSIPAYAFPLKNLAFALTKFLSPEKLPAPRQRAMKLITAAFLAHPYLIAGDKRFCSFATHYQGNNLMVKVGAEGVYTCLSFDQGLAVALKARDGNMRASTAALAHLLLELGVIAAEESVWTQWRNPEITNWRKFTTGRIQVEL